jgi:carbonic anhydrase
MRSQGQDNLMMTNIPTNVCSENSKVEIITNLHSRVDGVTHVPLEFNFFHYNFSSSPPPESFESFTTVIISTIKRRDKKQEKKKPPCEVQIFILIMT